MRAAAAVLMVGLMLPALASALQFQCSVVGKQPLLQLSGAIEASDGATFKAELTQCRRRGSGTPIVELDSGGGSLAAGIEMGRHLFSVAAHTRVGPGKACISACVFTFLGGRFREVMPGGSLEPHGFSIWRFDKDLTRVSPVTTALYLREQWFDDGCADCRRLCRHLSGFSRDAAEVVAYCNAFHVQNGKLALPRSVTTEGEVRPHPDDRRAAAALVDAGMVLSTAMMELEREIALRHLRDGGPQGFDQGRYVRWVEEGFRRVAATHYGKPDGGAAAVDPAFEKDVERVVAGTTASAQRGAAEVKAFFDDLRRHDPIDALAFAKLMFSTSIIYTRPLTSKEMCRAGVVTIAIDC